MLHILNLFGRSPFLPLQKHMEKASECIESLPIIFDALKNKNYSFIEEIAEKISTLEHQADTIKNDIRNHLPKSLFMPIDKGTFLQILALQDSLADRAEDIAVLLTLRKIAFHDNFETPFFDLLHRNLEAFRTAKHIVNAVTELVESSFGGAEAEKVKSLVSKCALLEHEADILQRTLLKHFFKAESQMHYGEYIHWNRVFEAVGAIANISEKLANTIRMTLDVR